MLNPSQDAQKWQNDDLDWNPPVAQEMQQSSKDADEPAS